MLNLKHLQSWDSVTLMLMPLFWSTTKHLYPVRKYIYPDVSGVFQGHVAHIPRIHRVSECFAQNVNDANLP